MPHELKLMYSTLKELSFSHTTSSNPLVSYR